MRRFLTHQGRGNTLSQTVMDPQSTFSSGEDRKMAVLPIDRAVLVKELSAPPPQLQGGNTPRIDVLR